MTDPNISHATDEQPAADHQSSTAQPQSLSPKLGKTARYLGLGVFVLSIIASFVLGFLAGPYVYTYPGGAYYQSDFGSSDPGEVALSVATLLHIVLGTVVGVTALVMGLFAVIANRGRGPAIVGMVFAFVAPGLSFLAFLSIAADVA